MAANGRIQSLDVIRGAVMVLMALDHVRVFSGIPPGGPSPGLFFTRWITNFCAPAFVFLAGTGAFLYGRKQRDPSALSIYLVTRGLVLVLLELTVLRFAWTFNLDYSHYMLAGVIWMIGWCMILMAGLVRLPVKVIAGVGLTIIAGHNAIDRFLPELLPALKGSDLAWLWQILYFGGPVPADRPWLAVLYSIVPWIGVMAAGYAFGTVMVLDPKNRGKWCMWLGLGSIGLFLVLRSLNAYGNPTPWGGPDSKMPAILAFLNTNKYPASLDFLLMTLGPTIALIPLLENARGAVARVLAVFGRVPLFYYLLHIPLIHVAALLVSLGRTGHVSSWLFENHPVGNPPPPDGYAWSLPLVYLVWALVVLALYFPSRWFAEVKRRRGAPWLAFL